MVRRVMVVEDDPQHRRLYKAWLELSGFQTIMVSDERTAQATAVEHQPDLALVDIRLPYISGLDIIRTIRSTADSKDIPVVAISVLSSREDEDACLAAGASCFLPKPISMRKLSDAIDGLTAKPTG